MRRQSLSPKHSDMEMGLLASAIDSLKPKPKMTIPKEVPKKKINATMKPSIYLLWIEEVEAHLSRERTTNLLTKAVKMKMMGPEALVARDLIGDNIGGNKGALRKALITAVYASNGIEVAMREWKQTTLR